MGLLDSLLGNASEVAPEKIQEEMGDTVLVPGEQVQAAFQVFRDSFIFTNKRMILIDRQGLTGSKTELHSIPYKSITQFSLETAGGLFDSDADIKLWISGQTAPVEKKISKKVDFMKFQRILAMHVLG